MGGVRSSARRDLTRVRRKAMKTYSIVLRASLVLSIAAFSGTAASALPCPTPATLRVAYTEFPRLGSTSDDTRPARGPGQILMGGGIDVDAAFVWAQAVVSGGAAAGGDLVVLRASGSNAYDDYLMGLANFNSVQTVLIPPGSTSGNLAAAATIVSRAEIVFFAGGDQADYVAWQHTALAPAVAGVYRRGGVVGGTSAGAAIQGEYVYDAIAADRVGKDVHTRDAITDPFEDNISFTRDPFGFSPLRGVVVDPHFRSRDRMGRLGAFMGRLWTVGTIVGVGVDTGNALVINSRGHATLKQQVVGSGAAYVLIGRRPEVLRPGEPLLYKTIKVLRLDHASDNYDFVHSCGVGDTYDVMIDGDYPSDPYRPADPYQTPGRPAMCHD